MAGYKTCFVQDNEDMHIEFQVMATSCGVQFISRPTLLERCMQLWFLTTFARTVVV